MALAEAADRRPLAGRAGELGALSDLMRAAVDGQAGTYNGLDLTSNRTRLAISDGVLLTTGTAQGALDAASVPPA